MEAIDSFDDGKNRCSACWEELAPQVNDLCERCRDLVFGTIAQNQAIADYYEHQASHPGCNCP